MTLQTAAKVTGWRLEVVQKDATGYVIVGYDTEDEPQCASWDFNRQVAIDNCVANNWRRVVQQVAEEQHWRCAGCDKIVPLQGHHKKPRSRGRDDRKENVLCLCAECHPSWDRHAKGIEG